MMHCCYTNLDTSIFLLKPTNNSNSRGRKGELLAVKIYKQVPWKEFDKKPLACSLCYLFNKNYDWIPYDLKAPLQKM